MSPTFDRSAKVRLSVCPCVQFGRLSSFVSRLFVNYLRMLYDHSTCTVRATGQKSRFFSNFACTPILTYKVMKIYF